MQQPACPMKPKNCYCISAINSKQLQQQQTTFGLLAINIHHQNNNQNNNPRSERFGCFSIGSAAVVAVAAVPMANKLTNICDDGNLHKMPLKMLLLLSLLVPLMARWKKLASLIIALQPLGCAPIQTNGPSCLLLFGRQQIAFLAIA